MDEREISIRWATGPDDLRGALALRELVFCEEQGVPREEDLDEHDERALHVVAFEQSSGGVIGTLRLLLEPGDAKIGRVAVARERRRQGVALRMLGLALDAARERGSLRVRLAAQLDAVALYEKAGFAVESETFEEAGIPHVWMGQRLTPVIKPPAES
ncbi:MAG TPA: GNAT family N-acetyltransferase [Solirubrobacteraceae bacterium]|jgi:predicted GNAT family N-acyltransferase|nr:GNAT family N-acetyltransferase [Solirubrobacteraceae bacterium]